MIYLFFILLGLFCVFVFAPMLNRPDKATLELAKLKALEEEWSRQEAKWIEENDARRSGHRLSGG